MSNEPAKQESTALTVMPRGELRKVLQSSLYPGASDASVDMVIGYCEAARLDVMLKPVHLVPMWDSKAGQMRDVVMPGIGLYRIQASRTNRFAGQSEPEFGPMVTETISGVKITYPEWARVTVKKQMDNGAIVEFTAKEFWIENYAIKGGKEKSQAPNAMWSKRPRGQIGKCAAAQALRLAFPEMGSQPTAEEMEGKAMLPDDQPAPTFDYLDPAMFMKMIPECKTDAEAAKLWADHNGKFAKQPTDHAAFKAAVIAHRMALKQAAEAPAAKTFEEVMQLLCDATNEDALFFAGELVHGIADQEQVALLNAKFDERSKMMRGES